MRKGLVVLLFVSWAWVSPSSQAEPISHKRLDKRKWTQVTSPSFELVSDAKPKQVLKIAEQLERFRAFSSLLLGAKNKASSSKARILLTKKRSTWRALGMPKDLVSYTFGSPVTGTSIIAEMRGFTGESLSKSNTGRATVFRALAFNLLADLGLLDAAPQWYRSSLASYLAGYVEHPKAFRIGELEAMGARLATLYGRQGGFIPIDIISIMSSSKFRRSMKNEKLSLLKRNRLDSQAYVLLHYFFADNKRRNQLSAFLDDVISESTLAQRIEKHFAMSPIGLAEAVKNYTETSLVVRAYNREKVEPMLTLPIEASYELRPLTRADFWGWVYPQLVKLPENMVSYSDKKALYSEVKMYLPTSASVLQ